MTYLAFDTSTSYTTVALSNAEGSLLATAENIAQRGQAKELVPLIQQVLKKSVKTFNDLKAIYVVQGPGSFTGIRLGLAAALGFKIAAGQGSINNLSTVRSVSAFNVLSQALDAETHHKYTQKPLLLILDTKRDDFFVQTFSSYNTVQKKRKELSKPKCISKEKLQELISLKSDWILAGHGLTNLKSLETLSNKISTLTILPDFRCPTASRILLCRVALEKENKFNEKLLPLYLRPAYVHEKQLLNSSTIV